MTSSSLGFVVLAALAIGIAAAILGGLRRRDPYEHISRGADIPPAPPPRQRAGERAEEIDQLLEARRLVRARRASHGREQPAPGPRASLANGAAGSAESAGDRAPADPERSPRGH